MGSGSQIEFWNELVQLKRDAVYADYSQVKLESTDRWLSIFGAIASSSAIGGWLIWNELSAVWAVVLALGQVYTVVKPYLPFAAQLRELNRLGPDLRTLALTAEAKWYDVSHGRLTDQEIHELTMSLKTKSQQAQHRAFNEVSLPANRKLLAKAEKEALAYVAKIGGVE